MTDEEIKALAKQARQKYCDHYNEGIDLSTYHCEDNGCPLYRRMNHCGSAEYYVGVLDGFKARDTENVKPRCLIISDDD